MASTLQQGAPAGGSGDARGFPAISLLVAECLKPSALTTAVLRQPGLQFGNALGSIPKKALSVLCFRGACFILMFYVSWT